LADKIERKVAVEMTLIDLDKLPKEAFVLCKDVIEGLKKYCSVDEKEIAENYIKERVNTIKSISLTSVAEITSLPENDIEGGQK